MEYTRKEYTSKERTLIMGVIVCACFICSMTNSATAASMPNIIKTLKTTQTVAQNILTYYSMCLGIVSACSAFLVNRFKTRPFFITCVTLFCIASAGCALSTSIWMLLVFRIVQGLSAGCITPMAQMVALAIFPEGRKGFGTSIIGMVMFASPALAPTIAGILLDQFSFRGVYAFIATWLVMVLILAKVFMVNVEKEGALPRLDSPSIALYALGFACFNIGMTNMSIYGISNYKAFGLLIAAAVLLVTFAIRNVKIDSPLLHLKLFKSRKYAVCVFLACVVYLNMMLCEQMAQQYLQVIRGYPATKAGIIVTCASILVIVISPLGGKFYDKFGGKKFCLVGFSAMTLGAVGLLTAGNWMPIILVALSFGVGNMANGWLLFPISAFATKGLPVDRVNHGVAIPNSVRLMFGALLSNIIVTTASKYSAGDVLDLHGYTIAMGIMVAVLVLALLASLFLLKKDD